MGKVEFSQDGGKTWEVIRLPFNCKPYHQAQLLGEYREGDNVYRRVEA
jgi:hypothetical protein